MPKIIKDFIMISGNRFPIAGTQADNAHDGVIRLVYFVSREFFGNQIPQDAGQTFPGFS
jgi:hypothetical protein